MADDSNDRVLAFMPVGPTASEVPMVPRTISTLIVSMESRAIGHVCPECCHWTMPCYAPPREFTQDGRQGTRFFAPMGYHEWLVWHHHIVTHQGLDRRMQVFVA